FFAALSPDAKQVLLLGAFRQNGSTDLGFYDVKTGKQTREVELSSYGFASFSPDSRIVAHADRKNSVQLFDAANGQLIRTLQSSLELPKPECSGAHVLWSPDGELVIVTNYFQTGIAPSPWITRVFHVASGKEVSRFMSNPKNSHQFNCIACSPNN